MKVDNRIEGKDATNKPHQEDRVEEKESFENKHSAHTKDGEDFEHGHVVMDSEAASVKKAKEAQKAGNVKKQDLSEGVGTPGNESAHLAHHNPHSKDAFGGEEAEQD